MEQETKSEIDPEKGNYAKGAASLSLAKGAASPSKSIASPSKSIASPLEEDEWEDMMDFNKEKILMEVFIMVLGEII